MKLKNIIGNICFILRYYIRYVPGFFFGQTIFTILVSAVWTIQGPVTAKYLFDALMNKKDIREILLFLVVITLLVVLRHIYACYIVEYMETLANITMQEKLLKELCQKASKMDIEYYETPQYYTDYVWAAEQATSQFKEVFGSYSTMVARLSETIFMGGVMVALNPMLLIFAVAIGIIRFAAQRRQIRLKYSANQEAKPVERERDYAKRVFYLSDYAKEIRLSRMHEVIHDRFSDANGKLRGIWKRYGKARFCVSAASEFGTEILGTFGMYAYLAYEVLVSGNISLGDFSALAQATGRFSNRLRQILTLALSMAEQSIYIEKFRRFMAYEPKIETGKGAVPEKELQPLVLKNVSFKYNGESGYALKNVNMTVHPHEKIAIVGYNGAGKTTLIKLLLRLYDTTEGEILLGDKNIREYDTDEYRKEFVVVFQDYQIFAATLGENVVMNLLEKEDGEKVQNALEKAGFAERLAALPSGLSTSLTKEFVQDGTDLSGGEKQKVAIARAFYQDSHFAIMDEPSSALDPIAEYKLNQNMSEIAEDKTVIFISHRLSTTVMADRIYMFENGEIIENGSHEELMKKDGKYAEMFKKQAVNYT